MEYYKDVRDQNGGHVDPNIFRTNQDPSTWACNEGSQTDPKDDPRVADPENISSKTVLSDDLDELIFVEEDSTDEKYWPQVIQ